MQRRFIAIVALVLTTAGCAEQPGKKKDEDTKDGKVEVKSIDGKTPAAPATAPAGSAPAAPATPPAPAAPK